MLGFGKKKRSVDTGDSTKRKKEKKSPAVEFDPDVGAKIHVMPRRFYLAPKKSRRVLWLIIIGGIVSVAGLAGAGYYVLGPGQPAPMPPSTNQPPVVNQNTNQPPVNVNLNINLNTGTVTSTPSSPSPDTTINVNQNTNTNAAVNTDSNTNVRPPVGTTQPPAQAPDSDNDKLTTAEEVLYGTKPNVSDTDGDGFTDGNELISGYDPTTAGRTLAGSDLMSTYTTAAYSVIYPNGWQVKTLAGDAVFQANTGEFVQIIQIANPDRTKLSDWYAQQFPAVNVALVTAVAINNFEGLRSPDRLSYYLVAPANAGTIYLLTYNIGNQAAANFSTTFDVMVSHFQLN